MVQNEEFRAGSSTLDLFFKRYDWSRYICMIVRESANLFYSRMKLKQDQLAAKAEAAYLVRESRHHGLTLLMDTSDDDTSKVTAECVFQASDLTPASDAPIPVGTQGPGWPRAGVQNRHSHISRRAPQQRKATGRVLIKYAGVNPL